MAATAKPLLNTGVMSFLPTFLSGSLLVRNGAFPMYLPAYCISTTAWKSAFVKVTVGK